MVDFFMDRFAKKLVLEQIGAFEWDQNKRDAERLAMWKAETRLMFDRFPAILVYDMIDECLAESSDKKYFEEKIFKKSGKSVKITMARKGQSTSKTRKIIDEKIKITDMAKKFGLEPDSKGRINCPFHADGNPSCFLNDEKNIFHCFGCEARGDIVEFYRRLNINGKKTSN